MAEVEKKIQILTEQEDGTVTAEPFEDEPEPETETGER